MGAAESRIEQRAARVSFVTGLSTVLTVVFQMVSVPVCLHFWGKERYGGWLALFSAFMLLRSLDGGFALYVGNKLNYLYHQNLAELRRHLSSAAAGIVLISVAQLLLAAGTLIFQPLAATLGMAGDQAGDLMAKLGLLVLIGSWVLTGSYLGIVHRLLIPAGLMYQAAWWAMGFQVTQFAAMMIAATLRFGMLQTSLLFALSQLTIYVTSAYYVRYKLPAFVPWWQGFRIRTGLSDLGRSLLLTASNTIQQTTLNGAVLVVAGLAGPVAVPVFTTVRTLTNLWVSVTTVLSTPLLPEVVRIHVKGEAHKLLAINQAYWVLVGSVVNWGTLLAYPLMPFVYESWTTHAVTLDKPLLCFMLGGVVLANAGALMALHLNGINSLGIVLSASVARAVLGLGVGAAGFRYLGLTSFGLGILSGELVATLLTGRYFVRHELAGKGAHLPAAALAPAVLGTGSALVFFIGAGFEWWSFGWSWLLALCGVAVGTAWGWRTLESSVRDRFTNLATGLFRNGRSAGIFVALMTAAMTGWWPGGAEARAPELLRTPGYESPVQGGPDDLLLIGGTGFSPTDRVVYEAIDAASASAGHPSAVPAKSTVIRGTAPIVKLADPPYSVTIQLPGLIQADRGYHIWVVSAAGEWSLPVSINDSRPLWITPAYVYSSADFADLGRKLRVVGRNLAPVGGAAQTWIQLQGPKTYVLPVRNRGADNPEQRYVSEAPLPEQIAPGKYSVAVSHDARKWTRVPAQQLEVRPDPVTPRTFNLSDPEFGGCRPDDGADDTACFARALEAARQAGGGVVHVPKGSWDVSTTALPEARQRAGLILAPGVHLQGEGASASIVIRHGARSLPAPAALLTLVGENSVRGLSFTDDERYESLDQSRAVIQLGIPPESPESNLYSDTVDDVVISGNTFNHVGRALVDGRRPLRRLFVTHNEFGAYDNALLLTGGGTSLAHLYRIDDSVFRWNRFVPGSYAETIATQLGAAGRVDFSDNVADGTSVQGLQDGADRRGWRAAFFWNLTNDGENLLISDNQISCSGDKASDGEAVAFDNSGGTFGFDAAQTIDAAGPDWVRINRALLHEQFGQPVPDNYYNAHWLRIVAGPGLGQTRRVESYTEDRATGMVTLRISPSWDVVPSGGRARAILGMQFWQVYVVANAVNHAAPPCRKANLNGPHGGVIVVAALFADSVIEANRQVETDGIEIFRDYTPRTKSCPSCGGVATLSTALEIRGNLIDGEYDWSSDCSWSGIRGYFVATPTPEEPPPILGFGDVIAHNVISRADGQRGGAIDITHAGATGPPPGNWPMVQSVLIFGNVIRDISGELPRSACRDGHGQRARTGIRLEGPGNIRDTVLEGNRCERVDTFMEDSATATARVCHGNDPNSCECGQR
jgi:O-antigen/teichoic acid export membrane protein